MTDDLHLNSVKDIISRTKPHRNLSRSIEVAGCGYAIESIFAFDQCSYYWIVLLEDMETFAYKKITADWVEFYSNVVLSSPAIQVCFNIRHQITSWVALQEKVVLEN